MRGTTWILTARVFQVTTQYRVRDKCEYCVLMAGYIIYSIYCSYNGNKKSKHTLESVQYSFTPSSFWCRTFFKHWSGSTATFHKDTNRTITIISNTDFRSINVMCNWLFFSKLRPHSYNIMHEGLHQVGPTQNSQIMILCRSNVLAVCHLT